MSNGDFDFQSCIMDNEGNKHFLLPQTLVKFCRMIDWQHKHYCPSFWGKAIISFSLDGSEYRLVGITATNLETLGDFFTKYANRLRDH